MNASYSIPETAKLTGIPEHAIREYAKQFADVLPPPETNGEGARPSVKRYPDSALAIFRSIRKLKDEGLDSAQIRSALQGEAHHDGYLGWENIALETSAEAALTAETGDQAEWDETPVETTSAEWGEENVEASSATEPHAEVAEDTSSHAEATADAQWAAEGAEEGLHAESEVAVEAEAYGEDSYEAAAEEHVAQEGLCEAPPEGVELLLVTQESAAGALQESDDCAEAEEIMPAAIHPLFTNLNDGLRQLRKIMDENTHERESLRLEREQLLADTAAKRVEIEQLRGTVATQEEKIGGLQSALSALMAQCDQQLQAIRSALGQA